MKLLLVVLCLVTWTAAAQQPETAPVPDAVAPASDDPAAPAPAGYNPSAVKFVVGGIVPKEQPYIPLNGQQRWRLFLNENFSLTTGAYFRAFGSALPDHLDNRPESWDQGAEGYLRRVGDRFARFTLSSALEHAGATVSGQDPRYVRCKCDGFWRRFGHASQMTLLTYNSEGQKRFFWSRFAGAFGGEAISAAWNPEVRWDVRGYQGAIQQVGATWVFNVIREFSPDIKRVFARHGKATPAATAAASSPVPQN